MAKKMLIDATHAEETRVVVVDGNKVEEFDFESENKRQLAGNIYLAKVTRVEPSLQAAFVEYGGNRHGFLAFSEIHPDYYQIPVADREALMEEERAYAETLRARDDEEEAKPSRSRSRGRKGSRSKASKITSGDAVETKEVAAPTEAAAEAVAAPEVAETPAVQEIAGMETIDLVDEVESDEAKLAEVPEGASPMELVAETPVEEPVSLEEVSARDAAEPASGDEAASADAGENATADVETPDVETDNSEAGEETSERADASSKDDSIESVADEDDIEDIRPARKPRARRYKIQEVIKVRQVLLVQVVKEERGNKGAALTTYLSLAGRYCVLMPNTARGGGISRKITNAVDRKKLKDIATELDVPSGAGLIVRTAGAKRTKAEIKRDYEYLQRLWEQIRELTLKSVAPAKIYEEGDLIKRSIRDLYNREIDEVLVEGERGYRIAKDFMKMIMPSHAKNVKNYQETLPLFARFQVESYLSGMFNPTVQLRSGGYIVIDSTEALVAVDVNSGRATKQSSIEETALNTNLEAAEEVARQLRLRDLAGLIVIDFIDMDERKNNAAVENRMKDKLKTDRARIQVGRISGFGLMEMSRQRLRPGMIEATTKPCPHCHGTGLIRSDDSLALSILRQIEEEGTRRRSREVLVRCPIDIANYLMNQKREHIAQIEARYGLSVRIEGDAHLVSPDFTLEKLKTATRVVAPAPVVSVDTSIMAEVDAEEAETEEVEAAAEEVSETPEVETDAETNGEDKPKRKRRRRRRRKSNNGSENSDEDGGDKSQTSGAEAESDKSATTGESDGESSGEVAQEGASDEKKPSRSRTRTRGGRSRSKKSEEAMAVTTTATAEASSEPAPVTAEAETVSRADASVAPAEAGSTSDAAAEQTSANEAVAQTFVAEDAPLKEPAPVTEPAPAAARAAEKPVDVAEPAVAEAAPVDAAESKAAEAEEAPKAAAVVDEPPSGDDVQSADTPQPEAPQVTEAAVAEVEAPAPEAAPEPVLAGAAAEPEAPPKPKRRGWWSKG
jgi:ribonuclease E